MQERVIAVVVTWNRQPLLARIVEALQQQSRVPDVILVVDNDSSDGTAQWLHDRGAVSEPQQAGDLVHLRLPRNLGGAGGFHTGLRWALDQGATWAWLMDDDGLPGPECLEQLLARVGDHDFFGPLVVAEGDRDRLCFPIRRPGHATALTTTAAARAVAAQGLIRDIVIPFNGVLVSARLGQEIGYPREDFFIWGDDVEYLWRARKHRAKVATAVDVEFSHPSTDELGSPMAWGRSTYNHSPSDLKHYCLVRNNYTNLRDYRGRAAAAAFLAKTVWFYTLTRPDRARLGLSWRAYRAARAGDFEGHLEFLR